MATIPLIDPPNSSDLITSTILPVVQDTTPDTIVDAAGITWTAAGGNTSTITDCIITDTFDRGNITVRFTNNDIIRTEEEPPKTYLQLPTGKRLISI